MQHFTFLVLLSSFVLGMGAPVQAQSTRQLSKFQRVEVSNSIVVTMVPSDENKVELKVSNLEPDDIKTKVAGGKLEIKVKGTKKF